MCEKCKEKRNAAIVYSGGDDIFIVGAWDDVIELSVDVRKSFSKYTENTLTLSAGIGIYHPSYPISAVAEEVSHMEDVSKDFPGKNAVTLFEDGESHEMSGQDVSKKISDGTYSWMDFENGVIEEKLRVLKNFFDQTEDYGKTFMYHLLELIRNQRERINFARYVYLLARMEPSAEDSIEKIKAICFNGFIRKRIEGN